MDRRRGRWVYWLLGAMVPLIFCAWRATVLLVGAKLEIGPETTYITGPMTPDGRIDYSAALHERLSAGVLPEDNAAVLIDRTFGPGAISPELRSEYFARTGVDQLPEQGNYLLTQSALMKQKLIGAENQGELNAAMMKEFSRAQQRPWMRDDCPLVFEWLERNAEPLQLIEQAARRSQYYSPLVTSESLLQAESTVQNLREAARLLLTRATFRMAENDVTGAWSDLLTCHRLALLASQRAPHMITYLTATALEGAASNGDAVLITHGLTAEQARKCLADLDQLALMSSIIPVMDFGQRIESLDAILYQMSQAGLDVNTMLRRANRMYDDIVVALKQETYAGREQELAKIDTELKKRIAIASQPLRIATNLLFNSRRGISDSVGDTLMQLLMPAYTQANNSQTRIRIRRDLVRIGFALAAYRAERGNYPQTLDELVPGYLAVLPIDGFNERPLVYVPRDDGFLIYSVGANGRDDGGRIRGQGNPDDVPFEIPFKPDE